MPSYKGQLHFHSTESDGVDTPTDIITAYKTAGYDFVCLTDHDKVTVDPSVGGILFINGEETGSADGHIGHIFAIEHITGTNQTIIDNILAEDAICILNHPNYTGATWTEEELENLINYSMIEVFNSATDTEESKGNSEDKWDYILSNIKNCFAIAGDDCHDITGDDFNKAWIVVNANSCTETNIKNAIRAGDFYSTTGATLNITIKHNIIYVTTEDTSKIEFIGGSGRIIQTNNNTTTAEYSILGDEIYIRVKITRNSDGAIAWGNPHFLYRKTAGQSEIRGLSHG